jgi:uncharacterized protein YegL
MFLVPGCEKEVDLVFLLDTSGSVGQGNFNKMLMFVDEVVRAVGFQYDRTRLGIITFSSDARVAFHLGDYKTQRALTKAIMAVPYTSGQTNMAAALRKMREDMFVQVGAVRVWNQRASGLGFDITTGHEQEPRVLDKSERYRSPIPWL